MATIQILKQVKERRYSLSHFLPIEVSALFCDEIVFPFFFKGLTRGKRRHDTLCMASMTVKVVKGDDF